jgi:hypothetical protein
MIRAWLAALVLAVFITACGHTTEPASSTSATPSSSAAGMNVSGVVDRSGQAAACPTDEPCDPPLTAVYLVFSRQGNPDVRVPVAGDGKFAVRLDPGAYKIAAAPPPMRGKLTPNSVRVPQEGTVSLRLVIA